MSIFQPNLLAGKTAFVTGGSSGICQAMAERFADAHPTPEQLYASAELSARVKENLQTLSPLLRNAFELRELEGLTADEAARALGVSRNTLKARLWRARQQLAGRLGDVLRQGTRITQSTGHLAARLQPAAGVATGD